MAGANFLGWRLRRPMKRSHGAGRLYVKWGSYYGRWRALDGRYVNRRIGKVRARGQSDGITKAEAERALRRLIEAEDAQPPPARAQRPKTVDDAVNALRERLQLQGVRPSYEANLESMQRIHISSASAAVASTRSRAATSSG